MTRTTRFVLLYYTNYYILFTHEIFKDKNLFVLKLLADFQSIVLFPEVNTSADEACFMLTILTTFI